MTNRAHAPYTVDGRRGMSTNGRETGTFQVKSGLAQMLKGGVIMDVVTPEHARIAEPRLSPRSATASTRSRR